MNRNRGDEETIIPKKTKGTRTDTRNSSISAKQFQGSDGSKQQ